MVSPGIFTTAHVFWSKASQISRQFNLKLGVRLTRIPPNSDIGHVNLDWANFSPPVLWLESLLHCAPLK